MNFTLATDFEINWKQGDEIPVLNDEGIAVGKVINVRVSTRVTQIFMNIDNAAWLATQHQVFDGDLSPHLHLLFPRPLERYMNEYLD